MPPSMWERLLAIFILPPRERKGVRKIILLAALTLPTSVQADTRIGDYEKRAREFWNCLVENSARVARTSKVAAEQVPLAFLTDCDEWGLRMAARRAFSTERLQDGFFDEDRAKAIKSATEVVVELRVKSGL